MNCTTQRKSWAEATPEEIRAVFRVFEQSTDPYREENYPEPIRRLVLKEFYYAIVHFPESVAPISTQRTEDVTIISLRLAVRIAVTKSIAWDRNVRYRIGKDWRETLRNLKAGILENLR